MPVLELTAYVLHAHAVAGRTDQSEVDEVGGLMGGARGVRGIGQLRRLLEELGP